MPLPGSPNYFPGLTEPREVLTNLECGYCESHADVYVNVGEFLAEWSCPNCGQYNDSDPQWLGLA